MDDMKGSSAVYNERSVVHGTWPAGERGNIVLQNDTAVELGNPRDESASFLLWTDDGDLVHDGMFTCIGPEISSYSPSRLPLGKAVILAVTGFTEDNCYERYREIELIRYDLNLRGYMLRAVSQHMREWSRISRQAMEDGFSLEILASVLMERYRRLDYVIAVEILFVTSSPEDVRSLRHMGEGAMRLIGAMNKMARELSFDCGTCDYTDICAEIEGLRSMRNSTKNKISC
jgi:CO dehydrogenase/acetyl-CoA synthase beta subunit